MLNIFVDPIKDVDNIKIGHAEAGDAKNEEINKLSKETLGNELGND